ncbi:MAG: hypothetical protein ACFBSE_08760, partial [Prochloraceae cyanobacterium]
MSDIIGTFIDNTLSGTNLNDRIIGLRRGLDIRDYSQFTRSITIQPGRINKGNGEFDFSKSFETLIGVVGLANAIDTSSRTSLTGSIDLDFSADLLTIVDTILGNITINRQNFVNVTGTVADDIIKGNSNNNVIDGGAGNDRI